MVVQHEQNQDVCAKPEECVRLLTELSLNMKTLVGNGRPGVISDHDKRIRRVEKFVWLVSGGGAVLGFIAGKVF
jgi:hypothetical protein